jgi:hypothetical protein
VEGNESCVFCAGICYDLSHLVSNFLLMHLEIQSLGCSFGLYALGCLYYRL